MTKKQKAPSKFFRDTECVIFIIRKIREKNYILLCIIRQAQAERICQKKDQMQRFKEKIQKLAAYNFADSIWISGSILSPLISGFFFFPVFFFYFYFFLIFYFF